MKDVQNDQVDRLRAGLLAWYRSHRRDLPWRRNRDPYAIWVSEIMLQQTRVVAVIERFEGFLARFPDLGALAEAPEQEVLAQWSGLGYYRRARMLHKAARFVVQELRGSLPTAAAELRKLPGIGAYTAAAIASIAHGEAVAVVDGNVERVLCRFAGWDADGGKEAVLRRKVEALAAKLVDPEAPGDFNQAMMELGATVCLPRSPQCLVCPWTGACLTRGEHKTRARAPMVKRETVCGLAVRGHGARQEALLEQRPASLSVMPGLWELPALRDAAEGELRFTVRHSIMQVNYEVRVLAIAAEDIERLAVCSGERRWVGLEDAGGMALTGLARKVLRKAHLLER